MRQRGAPALPQVEPCLVFVPFDFPQPVCSDLQLPNMLSFSQVWQKMTTNQIKSNYLFIQANTKALTKWITKELEQGHKGLQEPLTWTLKEKKKKSIQIRQHNKTKLKHNCKPSQVKII